MSPACAQTVEGVGNGVAASLRAVDCTAGEMAEQAFSRLFQSGGALGPVLTILMTLFIAFFAIMLMLGRSNLNIRSLMPRMITLGLVVTFATSWVAYQSVVWNLAIGAPDWLAGVITGDNGSATQTFADKIDVVFLAIQQATEGQEADLSAFSPGGMLWLGAMLFLLGTVGVLVTARIGLAVLVALGPIFVVLALFNGTRGLFTGWLKGVVMLALTPLFAVLGGGVMLELAVPILSALTATPGVINAQAAVAFFLIGAVHVALMIMVLKVSATMVGGWRVFGLAPSAKAADDTPAPSPVVTVPPMTTAVPQTQVAAVAGASSRRSIPVAAVATGAPANDAGSSGGGSTNRTTRVFATAGDGTRQAPLSASTSRTSGIGSRFRSANSPKSEKIS